MTEDSTRAIIGMIHDAFVQGDHERFASYYDDDVDWTLHAPISVFPFAGRHSGKPAVFLILLELYRGYKIERLTPQVVLANGDRGAALSDATLVQRATGRTICCRVASFYRLRNGRVVEYQAFLDSFDAVEQALGRYIDID